MAKSNEKPVMNGTNKSDVDDDEPIKDDWCDPDNPK